MRSEASGRAGAGPAYDAVAAAYDEQSRGDEWMRRVLWERYRLAFRPGQRILDVGCGTGTDAIFLARRGLRVTGIDASLGMIAQLDAKVTALGLGDLVTAQVRDFADLGCWPAGAFDGVISAFAGLSTAPDLAPFAAEAARLLAPRGRLLVHLLGPFSLWEWFGLLARGEWAAARQLGRCCARTFVIGGRPVPHYLFRPGDAYRRFFAPHFRLQRACALGVLRPPHTLRRIPPGLAVGLGRAERLLGVYRPWLNWGRLYLLELERRDPPHII